MNRALKVCCGCAVAPALLVACWLGYRRISDAMARRNVVEIAGCDAVAFSPDGRTLAVVRGRLELLEPATGKFRERFADGPRLAWPLVYSSDGRYVAAGVITNRERDQQDAVVIRDLVSRSRVTIHCGLFWSLVFVPNSGRVLIGGDDGVVRVYGSASGRRERVLCRLSGEGVEQMAVSPDGAVALIASGYSAKLVDVRTGRDVAVLPIGTPGGPAADIARIRSVCIAVNPTRVVLVGDSGRICTWDLGGNLLARQQTGWAFPGASLTPNGAVMAVAGYDRGFEGLIGMSGWVSLWDTQAGTQLARLSLGRSEPRHVAISPDGRTAAACGRLEDAYAGSAILWHAR